MNDAIDILHAELCAQRIAILIIAKALDGEDLIDAEKVAAVMKKQDLSPLIRSHLAKLADDMLADDGPAFTVIDGGKD